MRAKIRKKPLPGQPRPKTIKQKERREKRESAHAAYKKERLKLRAEKAAAWLIEQRRKREQRARDKVERERLWVEKKEQHKQARVAGGQTTHPTSRRVFCERAGCGRRVSVYTPSSWAYEALYAHYNLDGARCFGSDRELPSEKQTRKRQAASEKPKRQALIDDCNAALRSAGVNKREAWLHANPQQPERLWQPRTGSASQAAKGAGEYGRGQIAKYFGGSSWV